MAAEQDVGGTADWWELRSESRALGFQALYAFIEVSEDAPVRTDGERRWFVSDHNALLISMAFEDHIRLEGLPSDAPADVRAEVSGYLDAWHEALPFNEPEREIVRGAYNAAPDRPLAYREIPSQLRKSDFEVMESGVKKIVRGRELMRRWWAWRRELDEFEGQGNLGQAKEAVANLAGKLIPSERMPYIYYDLRGMQYPRALLARDQCEPAED